MYTQLGSKVERFFIKERKVGAGEALIIAEVAQAHDGSLGTAHAYIDAVADAGVDAIKFQTHIASAESTPGEPWRVKFSLQDKTRFEYWQRMEFTQEQWTGLYDHATERNLIFISSPFSVQAVDLLEQTGIDAWKIASGEVGNKIILERIADSGLPVLLSSGMSPISEIENAVKILLDKKIPFGIFQCSSFYPCPPEKVGLNMLAHFRERYDCPVGISDHSGTMYPSLAAASMGAELLEVHVTFSRQMFGPDAVASVTIEELKTLVDGVRFIGKMLAHPVDKDGLAKELQPMRQLFTKSVVAVCDLPKGTVLKAEHLTVKKPGTGIPPEKLSKMIGLHLKNDVKKNQLLAEDAVEWEK